MASQHEGLLHEKLVCWARDDAGARGIIRPATGGKRLEMTAVAHLPGKDSLTFFTAVLLLCPFGGLNGMNFFVYTHHYLCFELDLCFEQCHCFCYMNLGGW